MYYFDTEEEKLLSGQKCCGSELIQDDLLCCNNRGYKEFSEICADRTGQVSGILKYILALNI